jgi:hypothetical protein
MILTKPIVEFKNFIRLLHYYSFYIIIISKMGVKVFEILIKY